MKSLIKAVFLLLSSSQIVSSAPSALESRQVPGFSQRAIFTPPSNYRTPKVLYSRTVKCNDGSLLATWENYSPEPPMVYFPIYKSTNNGASWTSFSKITDQKNGWGMRYQPFLYNLPSAWAGFPAGTILAAGNSIPSDLSATHIDLYASTNGGSTWKFVSNIAIGGAASTTNGQTPVWEPFILYYNGALIVYYSDQRDKAYAQKLVHQSSTDGKTWSAVVNDVTSPTYTDRPGMFTIAQLGNGKWIATYEFGNGNPYSFPIYYKIANNPTAFASVAGQPLKPSDSAQPHSSPYVTWTSFGGTEGTIAVSCGSLAPVYTNTNAGAAGSWKTISVPLAAGYSRELRFLDNKGSLMITGAGPLGGNNYVSNAVTTV